MTGFQIGVAKIMRDNHMTQALVAEKAGIPRGTLNNYLRKGSTTDPSLRVLCALADAFSISIDELVGRRNA